MCGGTQSWLAGRGRVEAAVLVPAAIVVVLSVQLFFQCQLAFDLKFNL